MDQEELLLAEEVGSRKLLWTQSTGDISASTHFLDATIFPLRRSFVDLTSWHDIVCQHIGLAASPFGRPVSSGSIGRRLRITTVLKFDW